MVNLAHSVRMIRQAKELSLTEVAKTAGISTAFLSLIERGEKEPSLTVLRRIADALDVPSDVLLLLAQADGGSLRTSDRGSERLAVSLERLADAENMLRESLSQGLRTSESD